MNILITGANKSQCTRNFFLNQQLKVVPSHYSLYNCLVDMGHNVVQREVTIGENLNEYDQVFAYIAGPRQMVTTKLFNFLWTIYQRPDSIILSDDWQLVDLYKGLVACKDVDNLTCDFILRTNKVTLEDLEPNLDKYLEAINLLCEKKNKFLVSAFSTDHLPWNGMDILMNGINYPKELVYRYNPNPYHRNRTPFDRDHIGAEAPEYRFTFDVSAEYTPIKKKQFNFASLVQSKTKRWLKSQGFSGDAENENGMIGTWPVELYGSKAESQKRLTEDQMCYVFAQDWATLMPGYKGQEGSGWWRARPTQCADAKSILIGDKKDMSVYYGADFKYIDITAKDLVHLSDQELEDIALAQLVAIYKNHPLSKSQMKKELGEIL